MLELQSTIKKLPPMRQLFVLTQNRVRVVREFESRIEICAERL